MTRLRIWYRAWRNRRFEAQARRQFAIICLVIQSDPKARRLLRRSLGLLDQR